MAKFVCCKS